jgi:hypothetical protein
VPQLSLGSGGGAWTATQGTLAFFQVASGCLQGCHGPTVFGAPRDLDGCVNRWILCAECQQVIGDQSWTKAAWETRKP